MLMMAVLSWAAGAGAQEVKWQETATSGLVSSNADYHYNVRTTLGAWGGTMFDVSQLTKVKSGDGIMAFCTRYTNLGQMGDTLVIEKNYWTSYMGSSDFKRGQVAESVNKGKPEDISFGISYACLDIKAQENGIRQTLYVKDGVTIQLPAPTNSLRVTFKAQSDGRIVTTIIK